jgi:hypothetical protein
MRTARERPVAVCIAGMHRTGTSMVARLLNRCGVHLGPARELVPAGPDNPEGFWENVHFVGLNDMVLAVLGGTWDAPPDFPRGWEGHRELEELRAAARALLARFERRPLWGWKDPRNSLTLPFWRQLRPGLRVVVCVRNPLEVARSLERRDGLPIAAGLELWHAYYERLLGDLPGPGRILTHYAAYFTDPAAELARLLHRLGIRASGRSIAAACRPIRTSLRHHRATLDDLVRAGARGALVDRYRALDAETAAIAPERPRAGPAHTRAPLWLESGRRPRRALFVARQPPPC